MVEISVIIPCYNVEKYLNECLDSIITQSFDDIEIICVDDGSTDNTPNILKEYERLDSRVKLFFQENKGVGAARNKGLSHASGNYIYFADSDDYLEKNALSEMHGLAKDKSLDLLMFKLVNFNEKTNEMDSNYSNIPFLNKNSILTYNDFKDDLFRVDVTVYTKFFKRELIVNVLFDESVIFGDNIFFINYIFDAKRIYFYDKCLYYRRIRDDSVISSSNERHSDIIIVFNKIEALLKEKGLYDEFKESLFVSKINGCHYRYSQINIENKEYFFNEMKRDFESKKGEYEKDIDFEKIDEFSKALFENITRYESPEAFDLSMEKYHLENKFKKLKKENTHYKDEIASLKNDNVKSKLKKWSPF